MTAQPSPLAPQPSFGAQNAPRPKPSKAPTILVIVGAVILGLSLIVGITLMVIGISSTAGGVDDIEVFDSGSGTITAEEGESLQFYKQSDTETPSCDVTGPSEGAIGEGTIQTSSTSIDGTSWSSFDSITAEEAGDYTVDCFGTPVAVGPPVSFVGIFGAVGGILLAVGGGALGLLLLAIGVVFLILRKRSATA